MDSLEPFCKVIDPTQTLYTIITYNVSHKKINEHIDHRLQLAKKMTPSKKKTHIFSRLNMFKEHIATLETAESLNSIYFVGTHVDRIPLEPEWKKILVEWGIENIIFKYGETFEVDYVKSLLTDLTSHDVIYVKNNEYTHILLNKTKKKNQFTCESKSFNLLDYLKNNVTKKAIIHGQSSILKDLKSHVHLVYTKKLSDQELLEIFYQDHMKIVNEKLQDYLSRIDNPKLVFGSEITQKINEKCLQQLYCSQSYYDTIISKLESEYLTENFEIYIVDSLQKGDPGDRLLKDLCGAIGVSYY
jgi:hypothetical protein